MIDEIIEQKVHGPSKLGERGGGHMLQRHVQTMMDPSPSWMEHVPAGSRILFIDRSETMSCTAYDVCAGWSG
jgi:hypothetical protein